MKRTDKTVPGKSSSDLKKKIYDLESEKEQLYERLHKIVDITAGLTSCTNIYSFGKELLSIIAENMLASGGSLYKVNLKSLKLIHSLDPGHAPYKIERPLREDSPFRKVIESGNPLLVSEIDKQKNLSGSGWSGYRDSSTIIFPVSSDKKIITAILSLHTKSNPPFTRQDLEIGIIFLSSICEKLKSVKYSGRLHEAEAKFRSIFEKQSSGIVIYDKETGQITDANNYTVLKTGIKKGELKKKNIKDLFPHLSSATGEKGETIHCFLYAGNKKLPVITKTTDLLFSDRKLTVRTFTDLTERIEIEKALGKEKDFIKTLIEIASVIILVLDPEGNIILINPFFEKLTGYRLKELKGKNWFDILIPDHDKDQIINFFKKTIEERSTEEKINHIRAKDGKQIEIMWNNSALIGSDGSIEGILSIGQDLTKIQELERRLFQAEKLEAIGQLAGGIAHDFNNQLAGISGYAEMLKAETDDSSECRQYIEKILKAVNRASGLTSQLLTFSRKGQYVSQTVDLNEIVNEVVEILEHSVNKKIILKKNFKITAAVVKGDISQLQNAVLNLALNARDSMESGGSLLFETSLADTGVFYPEDLIYSIEKRKFIILTVKDTGTGIPEEIMEHIFEPFFTTKDKSSNSGLGLASVYGTIQKHGGGIGIKSGEGRGTTLKLYIPYSDDFCPEQKQTPRQEKSISSLNILLIEDEQVICEVTGKMLAREGHNVRCFTSSRKALDYYRSNWKKTDVVILDMVMPEMDGRETYFKMKKINPAVNVIIASGYSFNQEINDVMKSGVKAFIQKPYTIGELRENISRITE